MFLRGRPELDLADKAHELDVGRRQRQVELPAELGDCERRAAVPRARIREGDALSVLPERFAQPRGPVRREYGDRGLAGGESIAEKRDDPRKVFLVRRIDERLMD
jgi:hypothetical protein